MDQNVLLLADNHHAPHLCRIWLLDYFVKCPCSILTWQCHCNPCFCDNSKIIMICKSFSPCCRQTTTPAPHHSICYSPDAIPDALPTLSRHWRQFSLTCTGVWKIKKRSHDHDRARFPYNFGWVYGIWERGVIHPPFLKLRCCILVTSVNFECIYQLFAVHTFPELVKIAHA